MLEAKVPLIIVQFQSDYFCNPKKYTNWYGRSMAAVQASRAEPTFFFLNLPGDHDCAEKLGGARKAKHVAQLLGGSC